MNSNLSIVLLDDDDVSIHYIDHILKNIRIAKVVAKYNDPLKFIDEFNKFYFDILILDIEMPKMSGIELIKKVGEERCIINTASLHKYDDIIKSRAIDVLIKPANGTMVSMALERAQKFVLRENLKHHMFTVAEGKGKLMVYVNDILYITTDVNDYRNKIIHLRDGREYTLMNYSLVDLLKLCSSFIQVNKAEVVSLDAIQNVEHDLITLKILNQNNVNKQITLSRMYKKNLNRFL